MTGRRRLRGGRRLKLRDTPIAAAVLIACMAGCISAAGVSGGAETLRRSSGTSFAVPSIDPAEAWPGGAATSAGTIDDASAFSSHSPNMGFARELDFKIGNGLFRKLWVSAPSSTRASDGLGPLYNARGCQSCHLKDGRGHPPRGAAPEDRSVSMLLRLSIPPQTPDDASALAGGRLAVIAEPTYGTQLQELAIQGHVGEGRLQVAYEEIALTLADAERATLRKPTYAVGDLGYGPLHPATMLSPRVAPQMIGLGLLEAIPTADVLEREDPDDRDGDGISGKANWGWSSARGELALGRLGWKAGQPTVLDQVAEAFANDIGIGSALAPRAAGDCTPSQTACLAAPHGDAGSPAGNEISRTLLELTAFYARNLAVPPRRGGSEPAVVAGRSIFHTIGCAACHVPRHTTGNESPDPHLRGQTIWPYTDLLVHDMGEGLADGRPEGRAGGREWRTAPLWGIGLTELVSGHTFYLHDGRARNLTEAILWHGGEAQRARDAFAGLSRDERNDLLAFVRSL